MDAPTDMQTYRFGDFELDLGAHQLRLRNEPVRLERRPLDLLILLVARHGLLVTREEIIARLWPSNVVIDFDTGLNTLVRKVRFALGDSSEHPTFLETVPGLGYRFIAPLAAPEVLEPEPGAQLRAHARVGRRAVTAIVVVLVVAAFAVAAWWVTHGSSSPVTIAVLPFENLSGDRQLDYLAAGLAEDTSASLAQIDLGNLRMVGRISGQRFASMTTPEIGRELGVDFVIASSLRAERSKIRVTSRLIRVADNIQVWTASFDRELTSVLGLQSELSIAIAEQIRLRLSRRVSVDIARRQTLNPQAYDSYLRGRYEWSLLTPAASRRALEHYQTAIEIDQGYALAWAGIAQVLSTAPITGDAEPAVVADRAREAVTRALEFGPGLTEVQYASGYFHYFLDWNWPAAEAAFRTAVALDPNNAIAHLMLGHVLAQMHNQVEAREMARRARELDPFFSHTFAISSQIAFQARDYEAAQEFARQAIAINADGWIGYVQLGQVQAELGEVDHALALYADAERLSDGNSKSIAYAAYLLAKNGRADEARARMEKLRAMERERYVPPYTIAMVYAGLSERAAAFEWLERACEVRDVHMVFLAVDPRWDEMRGDPRLQSLLQRCPFDGTIAPAQTKADEGWTARPSAIAGVGKVTGIATFTSLTGRSRQMGMCLAQRYETQSGGRLCNTVDDCDSAPANLPSGGARYCVAPNGDGAKYCYYRPGERTAYCAGSPALNLVRLAPGAYRVEVAASAGTQWLALACFEACLASPMSISASVTVR